MASALTPREIQARIRGGASVEEVALEAGVDIARIQAFAGPVLAEREHMTRTALASSVRRRGDGTGHRRLADIISERLSARGLDSDLIAWDCWRRGDQKWVVVGQITDGAASRRAEFVFDPRARFSVTSNADARWMIGEELAGTSEPDNENTVDLDDEFALVRATLKPYPQAPEEPGDAPAESLYEESTQTSELDDLYDLMGGLSEDSVRIYVGLEEPEEPRVERHRTPRPPTEQQPAEQHPAEQPPAEQDPAEQHPAQKVPSGQPPSAAPAPEREPIPEKPRGQEPKADPEALIEAPDPEPGQVRPRSTKRRRAKVPTWDEIMFGGKDS